MLQESDEKVLPRLDVSKDFSPFSRSNSDSSPSNSLQPVISLPSLPQSLPKVEVVFPEPTTRASSGPISNTPSTRLKKSIEELTVNVDNRRYENKTPTVVRPSVSLDPFSQVVTQRKGKQREDKFLNGTKKELSIKAKNDGEG